MARLVFGGDLAYNGSTPGTPILNAANDVIQVFRDAAGSVPETDLQTYPGAAAVTSGQLNVTTYSKIPLFYGPNSGADTLYIVIAGGPITPIYASDNDRLEALSAGVAANTTAIANEAQTARDNEAAAIVTAETFATGAVGSETSRALGVEATKAPSLSRTAVKTANYAAAANDLVPVDTTNGAINITLPTAPATKTRLAIKHIIQGGTNVVTVLCGGSDVFNKVGGATSLTLPLLAQAVLLDYDLATHIWTVLSDDLPLTDLDARYAATATVSPTKGSDAWLKLYAANPDTLIVGAITRDANGAATSAPVVWPDGTAGTYTADTVSTSFPGAVDAYYVTYGSPATKTVTQSAVTRDATTGAVTTRPALTVA